MLGNSSFCLSEFHATRILNRPLKGKPHCKSLAVLGKFISHETTALPLRCTSFTQNWKQFRQGLEQQRDGVPRNKKLGGCNADEFNPMGIRKKCQIYGRGFWNDVWQRGRTNYEVGVTQTNSAQWTRVKKCQNFRRGLSRIFT